MISTYASLFSYPFLQVLVSDLAAVLEVEIPAKRNCH